MLLTYTFQMLRFMSHKFHLNNYIKKDSAKSEARREGTMRWAKSGHPEFQEINQGTQELHQRQPSSAGGQSGGFGGEDGLGSVQPRV